MDLIFFGMQGAGKGTLGKSIAERYGMKIFETGGELRKLAQEESELGKKIKSIIEAGHLVSDEVVMEIVENFLSHLDKNSSVLFDGIPRKVEQAKLLNDLLLKHNREYKGLLIDIKKETALRRLTTRRICKTCKAVYSADYNKTNCEAKTANGEQCDGELITRSDDNPSAIETRLNAFENETVPAIKIYEDRLIKIDGEPRIEEVEKLAISALDTIMKV
ncbi:nucleoside monophosphate kinase [Candidatus Peregrinibacteria bacterium]|nr:nucleoside monophosphate kinase [Candidatus Peregrinibacteria bacterium]